MSGDAFKFCPRCATPLVSRDHSGRSRLACPAPGCGFIHWGNPLPVVGALVEHRGLIVLARGKGWPEKMFGIITGFLEAGETPEAGVRREVKEELGVDCRIESLIGVYAFELRNEFIACWHVRVDDSQELRPGDELEAVKTFAPEKLRAWDFGTGLAVRDWLARRKA